MARLPSISSQAGEDAVETITNIKNIDLHSKTQSSRELVAQITMRGLQNPTLPLALLVSNTDSPLCARFEQIESDSPYNIRVKVKSLELPKERSGHLQILLCLTPDDFTRQWGTPWQ